MKETCLHCKKLADSCVNVRNGYDSVEGRLLAIHSELLNIPQNMPLNICHECYNTLKNINTSDFRTEILSSNPVHSDIIVNSENLQIESESLTGSNITENTIINQASSNDILSQGFDIDVLRNPGEIEKLVSDRAIQNNIRNIISKTMPAGRKRQQVLQILADSGVTLLPPQDPLEPQSARSIRTAQELYHQLVGENDVYRRRYKTGQTNSSFSNLSISSGSIESSRNISPPIQHVIVPSSEEISGIPPSPIINPGPSQQFVDPYVSDESSNRGRVSPINSSNGGRVSPVNSSVGSDRSLRRRERRFSPIQNNSNNPPASQRPPVSDDGNVHTNVGAPRRIQRAYNPIPHAATVKNNGG